MSATPWQIGGGQMSEAYERLLVRDANLRIIARIPHGRDGHAHAQRIVTAVNCHADLLAALKAVVAVLQKEAPGTALNHHQYDAVGIQAHAAIAKAESHS